MVQACVVSPMSRRKSSFERRRYPSSSYRSRAWSHDRKGMGWRGILLGFFLSFVAGICLGVWLGLTYGAVAHPFVTHLKGTHPSHTKKVLLEKATSPAPSMIKPKKASDLQFDFYTELPQAPANVPPSHDQGKPIRKGYKLLLTQWFDRRALQYQKARLSLLGFDVEVLMKPNHKHRIMIGPYANFMSAKRDQAHLKNMKINTLIKKFG